MNTTIIKGVKAIVIAEDDDAIAVVPPRSELIDRSQIRRAVRAEKRAENTLILGWNRRGPLIAFELSRYVAPGSVLTVAADTPGLEQELRDLALAGGNLHVELCVLDTGHRASLETLDVPAYDHVIVLGYSDHRSAQAADTRTLVTLLHLRKIADAARRHVSVVSEMIDVRNRELAEVTRADDFVVSNKLVSLMLAQASENDNLAAIFAELLDENGAEIYMRPITDYVAVDRPVTFLTIVDAARQRGEVAFGYRRNRDAAADGRSLGGVVVNPVKSATVAFDETDKVIILAHEG